MNKTNIDEYSRQLCPHCYCNTILRLQGAWSYDGRIHTDRFSFRCEKCFNSFTRSAEETEQHQDGIEAEQMDKKVQNIKTQIKNKQIQQPTSKVHCNLCGCKTCDEGDNCLKCCTDSMVTDCCNAETTIIPIPGDITYCSKCNNRLYQ